jgi:hypothetical protein
MTKRFLISVLLMGTLVACRSVSGNTNRDSLNKRGHTPKSYASENLAPIKKYKIFLAGDWVNKDYFDEIKRTKSTQQAYGKAGPITDMLIDTGAIKADTLLVQYNSSFHEAFSLIINFKPRKSDDAITAYDPADYIDRKFYKLKINAANELLTVFIYDKQRQFVDSVHFFKPPTRSHGQISADDYLINQILISGNYVATDSLKNSFKVSFTNDGKMTGLNDFKTYGIGTDFMTPPNNIDQIFLDGGKTQKMYGFKINADTLNLYETKDAPDSVNLVLTNLKYKMVRQK